MESKVNYFDRIAPKQAKRRFSAYYWRDIEKYCNYFSHKDISVLEIGCGGGDLIGRIKGKRKVGIDFSPAMIEVSKKKYPETEFIVMDAQNIQLTEKFDLILISNVIGHVNDVQELFEQLPKVMHRDSKVIVTYYNYLWEPLLKFGEFTGLKTKTPRQNWLSISDIENLLYLAGLEVYRHNKRMIFPIYIPLLSYIFNKFLGNFFLFRWLSLNIFTFARFAADSKCYQEENEFTVSVIVPARNESGNIEAAIQRTPLMGKHTQFIFVEGNSTDDTWEKIQEIQKKYSATHDIKIAKQPGKGKADAVRHGYGIADGEILMILDADLTMPPEDLPKFYNALAYGKGDFINGTRLVYPMESQAMRFLNLLANHFFSIVFSWLLEQRIKDTLCGTKVLFRKDYDRLVVNREYFGDFDPFGDFDLLFGAHKLNLKIVEVPIRYRDRTYGSTNISRFRHGFILLGMSFFALRKIKYI
ncbi:MAG TPA: bifunctional class I SAM-dependent methyltransferase/glycosyltransferase family 2 protein [Bacteroidia bacterium]|jgi:ubiquinone/menaquinone biosynthesis C-methylase UbiE|nr:bifunctional class I SAM-dependent methyltransferase/glycosyltransferase family 2 protein [Bacteroidia bacterium]